MFGHYFFLVTFGYLNVLETSVIPQLPCLNAQNISVVPQENDLSGKRAYSPSRSSYLTSVRPSQNMVHKTPAGVVDIEEGNFFEGDIILRPEQQFRLMQKQIAGGMALRTWPGGILYYEYSDEFHDEHKAIIERAISDLQRETCVRFVRRTTEPTYILFRNTNRGCASQVGYHPTGRGMDLYLSSPGCLRTGTIQHELLHALGFWHEHTRPDRDAFISILWNNIVPGREFNFRARSHYEPHEWLPYDYNSVMHYRAVAFSKDRLSATIVPRDSKAFFAIGQRVRVSPMDLAKLNALYNCDTHSLPSDPTKGFSSEDLFSNSGMKKDTSSTESEKRLFSNPETETETSPSEHEDNTSPPKPEKDISSEDHLLLRVGQCLQSCCLATR
ncbi:zinc metalloproteinase nas-4-like [Cryptotermes secundus]|uniref:zinc metalloproteinase nas-4-like n=1 Tax=Cryptotermes secundus TaxID=105785 RepID=UPI000CD7AD03|nr:zinc metalloproteinase nas-4-like [Cryptotermes secundus]